MISTLLSCLLALALPLQFRQVPVVTGRDVAVATVPLPDGAVPKVKASGLPGKALQTAYVKDSLLYIRIDGSRIKDLSKPFRLTVKADGSRFVSPELRLARSVRTAGDDGVAAYRIPGLVLSPKGTLIASYDIRHRSSMDLQNDIDVGVSRSADGGLTWEPMQVAMDMGEFGGLPQEENGIGDPCILVDEVTGELLLFAVWVHGGKSGQFAWFAAGNGFEPGTTPQLMMVRSADDGLTWSAPVNLTRQVKQEPWLFTFQAPGRGITMADGTLVVPFQHQEPDRTPAAGIMYSKDRGHSWQVHEYARINTTESQVAEVEPGVLMLNIRDNLRRGRAVYVTDDLGRSWTPHVSDGQLVEPVCMASLIHIPAAQNALGQDILLFSNPAENATAETTRNDSTPRTMSSAEPLLFIRVPPLRACRGWG